MTHILFILIGCAIIILTRRIYTRNFELFLCLLIPVNYNFFHLVPRIGEFDQYQESLLVVILFYLFEEFLVRPSCKITDRFPVMPVKPLGKFILLYLAVLILGVFVAYYHGQSLVLGLKAFKFYPLLLTYFLIVKRGLDIDRFLTYFIRLALGIAGLTFIQFLFFGKLSFFFFYEDSSTHIRGLDSVRGLRIIEGTTIIAAGTCMAFTRWLKNKKIQYLVFTCCLLAQIFIVMKTRAVLAAVLLVMLACGFLLNRKKMNKLLQGVYLLAGVILLTALYVSANPAVFTGQGIIEQTMSDVENVTTGNGTGNIQIRFLCYQHYWQGLQDVLLTGRGLYNDNWAGNPDPYNREFLGFYLSDIGFFLLLVNFGIAGGLLVVFALWAIVKSSSKTMKNIPEISGYFILGIIMLPQIDIFFAREQIFLFALFAACADVHNRNKIKTSSNNMVFG